MTLFWAKQMVSDKRGFTVYDLRSAVRLPVLAGSLSQIIPPWVDKTEQHWIVRNGLDQRKVSHKSNQARHWCKLKDPYKGRHYDNDTIYFYFYIHVYFFDSCFFFHFSDAVMSHTEYRKIFMIYRELRRKKQMVLLTGEEVIKSIQTRIVFNLHYRQSRCFGLEL